VNIRIIIYIVLLARKRLMEENIWETANCQHVGRNRDQWPVLTVVVTDTQGGTFLDTVSDHPFFHKETDPWSYSFSYANVHNEYQPRIMISYCKVPYVV